MRNEYVKRRQRQLHHKLGRYLRVVSGMAFVVPALAAFFQVLMVRAGNAGLWVFRLDL